MAVTLDLSASDLAALMCSKVCHDVISPVGALRNALELLDDPAAGEDAMDIVRSSARTGLARLEFCRIAFGAAGSAGAAIDTGDARKVAEAYIEEERPDLVWRSERMMLAKDKVKLALNLMLVGIAAVPRGGTVTVTIEGTDDAPAITVHATGKRVRVPVAFDEMMDGDIPENGIDAYSVQSYYTLLMAREAGMTLGSDLGEDEVTLTAR